MFCFNEVCDQTGHPQVLGILKVIAVSVGCSPYLARCLCSFMFQYHCLSYFPSHHMFTGTEGTENQTEVVYHFVEVQIVTPEQVVWGFPRESFLCLPPSHPQPLCTANPQPTQLLVTLNTSPMEGWRCHWQRCRLQNTQAILF